jgi:hypothetical protein
VQLEVKAGPPAMTSPSTVTPLPTLPPEPAGPSARRIGAFVAGGIGAAGVLIGAITGGLSLPDGIYTIDFNGTSSPTSVFCDMTTAGGGWTALVNPLLGSSLPPT